jgi:hypothetical protein
VKRIPPVQVTGSRDRGRRFVVEDGSVEIGKPASISTQIKTVTLTGTTAGSILPLS